MDFVKIDSKGTVTGFSPLKKLVDRKDDLGNEIHLDIETSIPSIINKVMITGSKNDPIAIKIHGNMICNDNGNCSIDPAYLLPSFASIKSIRDFSRVLNNYMTSFDDVMLEGKNVPEKINNVEFISLKKPSTRKKIGVSINKEEKKVDQFFIDPAIISGINIIDGKIDIHARNGSCGVATGKIDKKETLFCSTTSNKKRAMHLKSYLLTHGEQLGMARKLEFGSKTRKVSLKFDNTPNCFYKNDMVCCVYGLGDDEDPTCY